MHIHSVKFLALVLIASTTFLYKIEKASAQASVSIGDGFDCYTDIDGTKTLGKLEKSGFKKVKLSAVTAKIERQLDALDNKDEKLKEIIKGPKSLIDRLLIKFVRVFVKNFPDLDFETQFDDVATRNAVVKNIKSYTKQRRSELRAVLKLARNCKGGTTAPPQNGSIIDPTIKLVSFHGGQNAFAGFLVLTKPRIPKFATKPGGFNVCTRIEYTDPSTGAKTITGIYTGVGTDLCYVGGAIVDDNAVTACNATLPAGFVGLFLKKAQGIDLSDEGLRGLESVIVGNPPTVRLLALDQFTGSRDEAVARCEQFKQ